MTVIKNNRYEYIDALRGLAIILVLLAHVPHALPSLTFSNSLYEISNQGGRGVQLFYIISAYTIVMAYYSRIEKGNINLNKIFFIKRIFRIIPLFYLCLLFYSLRMLFFQGFGILTYSKLFSSLFFINGFNEHWINAIIPGQWSVAIEMVFYMTVPFWVLKINSSTKSLTAILISLIFAKRLILFLSKMNLVENDQFYYFFLPAQLPVFFLGVLLYHLLNNNKLNVKSENDTIYYQINVFLLIFFFCSFAIEGIDFYLPNHFKYALLFTLLFLFLKKQKIIYLQNKLFIYFGKISYSVYLIHFLFYPLMPLIIKYISLIVKFNNNINFLIVFVCFIILSGLVGYLFYEYIEKPFVNLGEGLIKKITN